MTTNLDLSERTSSSKRQVGRSVSINGVHAVDVELNKSENLNDPILDFNIKLNNPIGRLWLALKRMWKSQNTILSFKFTIPLIVLPIALYVFYLLWQGRAVNTPMTKLGVIHETLISSQPQDILVLPTSDVYLLTYDFGFDQTHRLTEKPVIVIGTYNHLNNQLSVQDVITYNPQDLPHSDQPVTSKSTWDTIKDFISQFR